MKTPTQEYFSNLTFTYFDDYSCQFERTKVDLPGDKAHPLWSAGGNILSGLGHEDSAWWVVNNLMEMKSDSIGRIWSIRCQGNSKLTVSSLICGPYIGPCFSVLHLSCLDLNNPVIPHFPYHNDVKPMRLLPKTYLFPLHFSLVVYMLPGIQGLTHKDKNFLYLSKYLPGDQLLESV